MKKIVCSFIVVGALLFSGNGNNLQAQCSSGNCVSVRSSVPVRVVRNVVQRKPVRRVVRRNAVRVLNVPQRVVQRQPLRRLVARVVFRRQMRLMTR